MAAAEKSSPAIAFGVFKHPTDENRTHIADSVDTANRLAFDGWQRIADPLPENDWQAQAATDQAKADKEASKK